MVSCAAGRLARHVVRVLEEEVAFARFRPRRAQEAQVEVRPSAGFRTTSPARTDPALPPARKIAMRSTSSVRDS